MKKILTFVFMFLLITVGLYSYNMQKTRNKITSTNSHDELTKKRSAEMTVRGFEAAYYELVMKNKGEAPMLDEVIEKFNNADISYRKATNKDTGIFIEDSSFKVSYQCEIKYGQCNYKIICLDESTSEFELGDC